MINPITCYSSISVPVLDALTHCYVSLYVLMRSHIGRFDFTRLRAMLRHRASPPQTTAKCSTTQSNKTKTPTLRARRHVLCYRNMYPANVCHTNTPDYVTVKPFHRVDWPSEQTDQVDKCVHLCFSNCSGHSTDSRLEKRSWELPNLFAWYTQFSAVYCRHFYRVLAPACSAFTCSTLTQCVVRSITNTFDIIKQHVRCSTVLRTTMQTGFLHAR